MKKIMDKRVYMEERHPLVLIIYFIAVITFTVISMNPYFLIISLISSAAFLLMLEGKRAITSRLWIIASLFIAAAFIRPLFIHRGVTVLFYINGGAITKEAIVYGIMAAILVISTILWFACVNRVLESDKILYLFGKISPAVAQLFSMSLRMIPLLRKRYKIIDEGQRGIYGNSKGRVGRFTRNISVLIAWSLEGTIETSDSMLARGYGLKNRSSYNRFIFTFEDSKFLIILIVLSIVTVAGCINGINDSYFYPDIYIQNVYDNWGVYYIGYIIIMFLPVIMQVKERISDGGSK